MVKNGTNENTDLYFIDSHFHILQSANRGFDPANVVSSASDSGLQGGMDIAVDLEQIDRRREYCAEHPGFGYSIGLYPSFSTDQDRTHLLHRLEEELNRRKADRLLWALGEIGMDFHWDYGTEELQAELFYAQLELASKAGLPVVIHNREADEAILSVLKSRPVEGIMHCFSSDQDVMKKFLDLGIYISFAGNLTFKNAVNIQEAARAVPLDRVLFETDAPYLTPVPHRGKPNQPENVRYVYEFFSQLRKIPMKDLSEIVRENFIQAIPGHGE